jgi:hypothetical protein
VAKGSIENVYSYHFEIPCFAGKIMQKRLLWGQNKVANSKNYPNLKFSPKKLLKFNLSVCPFCEKNHYFASFGLYRKELLGALSGARPSQTKFLRTNFFA